MKEFSIAVETLTATHGAKCIAFSIYRTDPATNQESEVARFNCGTGLSTDEALHYAEAVRASMELNEVKKRKAR